MSGRTNINEAACLEVLQSYRTRSIDQNDDRGVQTLDDRLLSGLVQEGLNVSPALHAWAYSTHLMDAIPIDGFALDNTSCLTRNEIGCVTLEMIHELSRLARIVKDYDDLGW